MLRRISSSLCSAKTFAKIAIPSLCSAFIAVNPGSAQEVILEDNFENRGWTGVALSGSTTSDNLWEWNIHTSSAMIDGAFDDNYYVNLEGASFVSATWSARDGSGYFYLDPHKPAEIEFDYLNLSGVAENRPMIIDFLMDNRWNNFGAGSNTDPVGYRLYFQVSGDSTVKYELLNKTGGEWPRVEGTVGEVTLDPGLLGVGGEPGRPVKVLLEIFGNKQKLSFDGVVAFDVDIDPIPQNRYFGSQGFVQLWSTYSQPRGFDNLVIREYEAPAVEPEPVIPGDLYWASASSIRTSQADGSDWGIVASLPSRSIGVAVDSVNEYVFWTTGGAVWRSNLDGTDPQEIIVDGAYGTSTQAIAVNPEIGKIYFTEWTSGLYSADLDGSNVVPLLDLADYGQASGSGAVAIDLTTEQVYWAEVITGTLVRLEQDGTNATTVTTLGANTYGLAVDGEADRLYYTVFGDPGSLNYYDLETGTTTTVFDDLGQPLGIALTGAGDGIYWAERMGGEINGTFVTADGFGDVIQVSSFEDSPFGLAAMPTAPAPQPPPAKRRLFVYDGFDYATGDLVGQNGGLGWTEAWVESNEVNAPYAFAQVATPGLTFGDLVTTGNKAQVSEGGRAFRSIDTAGINPDQLDDKGNLGLPGTSVWASFVVEGNTATGTDGFWGLSFFRDDAETLFFGKSSTSESLRLSGQGQTAQEFTDSPLSPTEKHFIVLRFDFVEGGDHVVTVFDDLDPMGRTPADEDAIGTFSAPDFSFNRLRLANSAGAGGTFDEIRVGATWADVTPVPFNGFVNGDFEDEPFDRGWSTSWGVNEHAGIVPGSSKAVFIPADGATGNPVRLAQFLPQWIELSGANPPAIDPITGERTADHFIATGPEWQLGFNVAVADAGGGGDRSLNLILGHAPSDSYEAGNFPVINFRITGDGAGQAYNNSNAAFANGWYTVLPAGTFEASVETGGAFIDPTAYYIQIDGDYSTETPFYTVSARRVGEEAFFAVSDPASYWQYEVPPAGSGIVSVHYHGYVQAPYVIDDVHLVTIGDSAGFAAWAEGHFNASELADPSISGPDADADGDGVANLLEYAFGGDPRSASRSVLPANGTIDVGGETYLTITYTRSSDASDLDYQVEASGDLSAWGNGAVEVSSNDNGDGTVSVTYRDSEPVGGAGSRFLRVQVSSAAQ